MIPVQVIRTAPDTAFEKTSDELGPLAYPANALYHGMEDAFSDPNLPEEVKQLQEKESKQFAEDQAKQKAYRDTINKGVEETTGKIQGTLDGIRSTIVLQTNRSPALGPPTPPR